MKHDNSIKLFIALIIISLMYVVVTKESFGNFGSGTGGTKPIYVLSNIYPTCLPRNQPDLTSDEIVDYFKNCADNSVVPCAMCNNIYKLVVEYPDNPELMDMYKSCVIRNNCKTLQYRKWFNPKAN